MQAQIVDYDCIVWPVCLTTNDSEVPMNFLVKREARRRDQPGTVQGTFVTCTQEKNAETLGELDGCDWEVICFNDTRSNWILEESVRRDTEVLMGGDVNSQLDVGHRGDLLADLCNCFRFRIAIDEVGPNA